MIFRILYAVIYSALVVTLTGIPQAALAVVSCQDTINPNTSIRYSDALVSFKAYNGRTYAIARSAATGGTSEAETFFDFSANISRAYTMTSDSTGSLKNLLSLGQYGAAMPVRIDSADTLQFILIQYGKYLGTASTPQSTYIDAWKEFGSNGFTTIDGTALSFTDWASPAYTGQDPQAVVMGADGKWTSGLDGERNAQIVQFDGTLDCAATFPPPGSGTTTTPPPTDSAGPDLSKPVCGQDLNGNGYSGEPGETANCLQTAQGLLCPVGAVNCVESYSAPVCPSGSTLNTSRDMCQADATVTCGAGYSYDVSTDKCVEAVTCPDGGTFNPVTDQCEKLVMNQCPTGYTYDGTLDVCRMSVDCSGGTLNPAKDRCEITPAWNCPTGFAYNATSGKCEASPYCPPGTTYSVSRDRCEAPIGSCPAGYSYNAVLDKCTVSVSCPSGGSLNGATDKCEITSSISCPSGTTYNSATGKCEASPACASPGSYSPVYDLCLTTSTGTTCPTGYTYSATYGTCIATPSCVGGTYSNTNDRCEASPSYTCSDPSYSYNIAAGRCEKSPGCSQGTYNSTYNKCLLNFTKGCPAGYTYNATRDRCEEVPECSQGVFNAVTNMCESGQVITYAAVPTVTGGVNFDLPVYSADGFTTYAVSRFAFDDVEGSILVLDREVEMRPDWMIRVLDYELARETGSRGIREFFRRYFPESHYLEPFCLIDLEDVPPSFLAQLPGCRFRRRLHLQYHLAIAAADLGSRGHFIAGPGKVVEALRVALFDQQKRLGIERDEFAHVSVSFRKLLGETEHPREGGRLPDGVNGVSDYMQA